MSFSALSPSPSPPLPPAPSSSRRSAYTSFFDATRAIAINQNAAIAEAQIRELESKLAEDLSNCRAIEGLLRDAFISIRRTHDHARIDALEKHIPSIHRQLDASLDVLTDLERRLPVVRTQVSQVRRAYDSGREKAKQLARELEWLNTEWYERVRVTMFTARAPVSWRWKVLVRSCFAVLFLLSAWAVWVGLAGAYRAHHVRLVWGGRLMS